VVPAEYLAGLVDGEGSLSLARRYHRERSVEYSVRVAVYNCDRTVLEAVRRGWGGHLASVGPRHPEWRASHSLIWTNAAATGVLRRIAPYLHVKARHAAALLQFQAHIEESQRSRDSAGRLLPISGEEMRIRARFHAHLKSMNRRGTPLPSQGESRENSPIDGSGISAKYLAGFIDAEGSLMIARFEATSSGMSYYRARVSLDNVDASTLKEIQRSYGGILFKQGARKSGWRVVHKLVWTGDRTERLLHAILPYLRVKRKQGVLLLRFINHRNQTKQRRIGNRVVPLPKRVITLREKFHARMRDLNSKGPR
jgi:hypothetical protein